MQEAVSESRDMLFCGLRSQALRKKLFPLQNHPSVNQGTQNQMLAMSQDIYSDSTFISVKQTTRYLYRVCIIRKRRITRQFETTCKTDITDMCNLHFFSSSVADVLTCAISIQKLSATRTFAILNQLQLK